MPGAAVLVVLAIARGLVVSAAALAIFGALFGIFTGTAVRGGLIVFGVLRSAARLIFALAARHGLRLLAVLVFCILTAGTTGLGGIGRCGLRLLRGGLLRSLVLLSYYGEPCNERED